MRVPKNTFKSYLRYILHKKNLSTMFYMILGISVIFLMTLLSLFLLRNLKMIFFILLLMVLGIATDSLNRFIPFSVGFELIMMGIVLTSIVYSPTIGIMVGILSLAISELFIMKFKIGLIISFFALVLVAFLASIFKGTDITILGIALTLFYDAIILPGYIFTGSNPLKVFIFGSTHIAWNIYVFIKIAPWFLHLMT